MSKSAWRLIVALLLPAGLAVSCGGGGAASPEPYRTGAPVAEDGTGRFYMDREIARVVETEHGLDLRNRPDRDVRELPERLVAALDLKLSDVVADIGSGGGYYTLRIAAEVPHGRVFAVDVVPALLDSVSAQAGRLGLRNVQTVLGAEDDPHLPESRIDLALIVVSYHEFTYPREMMASIYRALKPGGRVAIVEYRGEDPTTPVADVHRMSEAQIRLEMEAVGLIYRRSGDVLPQQHLLYFRKPDSAAVGANAQ